MILHDDLVVPIRALNSAAASGIVVKVDRMWYVDPHTMWGPQSIAFSWCQ